MIKPMAMYRRAEFSWKRGLLHAVVATALFFALGLIVFLAVVGSHGSDLDRQVGQGVGMLGFWVFLFTFVATYSFQTGKKVLGILMLLLLCAVFAGLLNFLLRLPRAHVEAGPLTAGEKIRPFRVVSTSRWCQPAFGLSFPDPGIDFNADKAVQQQLQLQSEKLPDEMAQWAWRDTRTGQLLILQTFKGVGGAEGDFRNLVAGIKHGIGRSGNITLSDENLQWMDDHGELTLTATNDQSGVRLQARCTSRGPDGKSPAKAACVVTTTRAGDPLRGVRAGLTLAPCDAGS
jgi:hypothetical protein